MYNGSNNSLEELNKFFAILYKHIRLIISITVVTVVIFAIAVFAIMKPKYQSSTELIVNQRLGKGAQVTEQQQIQATDLQLVNTYKTILTSQTVGNAVENKIGTRNYNSSKLDVNTDPTSQVITLRVTAKNPNLAAKIANNTAIIFKKKIKSIMNINNVSVISKAQPNKKPVSPKKTLILLSSIVIGIALGIFISLFKEYNAKMIDDKKFITDNLELTDLGTISDIDIKQIQKQIKR
jgi:capsular polysaccharide biosynthesis protein